MMDATIDVQSLASGILNDDILEGQMLNFVYEPAKDKMDKKDN